MPYPGQIDQKQIVALARTMIAQEGVDALSLHRIAKTLAVKTPSLYRHIGNKTELVRLINTETVQQLLDTLQRASDEATGSAQAKLLAVLQAHRGFAHAHAHLYLLLFTTLPGHGRPDEAWLAQMVLPLQALMAELCGEAESLRALRGALALAHGFVMLELHQQLQRGGDLGVAYTTALEIYLRGLQSPGETVRRSDGRTVSPSHRLTVLLSHRKRRAVRSANGNDRVDWREEGE